MVGLLLLLQLGTPPVYDRVLLGGRVMDPASSLDAVRNLGLSDGRIAVITTIIEKTPTNTPSNVSAERSLCAAMAFNAIKQHSLSSARHISGFRIWDFGSRISFAT